MNSRAPIPLATILICMTTWCVPASVGHAQFRVVNYNIANNNGDPTALQAVFEELASAWRALPRSLRRRVHLALLPTADTQENAAIVNALQRHARVVVQKSLHEGFGLTVTEAMWKGRAVVASEMTLPVSGSSSM